MRLRDVTYGLLMICVMLLASCKTTKFVPENQYLLDKVRIDVEDTKDVSATALKPYLRQVPNTSVLGFWKLQLHIYNTAPADTTTKARKRLARNAHKIGEAPEIYDPALTGIGMMQLRKAMQNKGYFEATVDTSTSVKKRKLSLVYSVNAHRPYYLRNYRYDLSQADLLAAAADHRRSLLQDGMLFDADILNRERERIASAMRNDGFFYFEREMLCYEADSSVGDHQVDVRMSLLPYIKQLPDSERNHIFRRYQVARVCFHTDYDPAFVPDSLPLSVSTKGNYQFTWTGKRLLRERVMMRTCLIKPGEWYNQRVVNDTYARFNSLGVIKYVDITFTPIGNDQLECHIVLSRSKLHSVAAQIEGTYASGDWGIAAEAGYTNRNIFHGAEELSLKVRGGYEWRQNGGRAIEAKVDAGLKFPNTLQVGIGYQYQSRPDEFKRTIATAGLSYRIHHANAPWSHTFKFIDISYVYLPWVSDEFRQRFLQPTNILKYSYEDHFIEAFSYTCSYSSFDIKSPLRSYGTFVLQAETAGNLLEACALLAHAKQDEDGKHRLFNIRYAQYVKMDFMFTGHHIINDNHRFVYRGFVGVAIPYGNADAIPFEKRYFSGGANSLRGWTARSLGPGTYRGTGNLINYDNQAGDIKLDLGAEYRLRLWKFIHAAAFVDAGNIWTVREYEAQPGGAFHWNTFYKQIGLSYGAGLRLDFSFLILRLDLGIRLHDPSRIGEGKQWRTVPNGLSWNNDMALHVAIGYPF